MTRETKIGLLVGLAFIIVVAILLSDPVNNANEPPAAIADTLGTVNKGLTVPAPSNPPTPAGTTAIILPGRVPGQDRVLTPAEAAQQTAQNQVQVGPPIAPLKPIIPAPQNDPQTALQQQGHDDTVVPPSRPAGDALQQIASREGEQIVPADSHNMTPADGDDSRPAAAATQHYTAQPGDSVSKMASRLMGANTKANRAAIVAANPSLKKDPNRVIVGEVYVIPGTGMPAAASTDSGTHAQAPTEVAQAPAPDRQPSRWYVVKPNDNLWRIATDELGDSGAVAEIESLNKDILKGGETIHANMRLRLPPKTVAAAD